MIRSEVFCRYAIKALLVIAAALPFNLALHLYPVPTFHSELIAVTCALLIFAVSRWCTGKNLAQALFPTSLLWLTCALWTTLTALWVAYDFNDQWLVPALAFACLGLAVIGLSLTKFEPAEILTPLAAGLVLGGIWQSIASTSQLLGIAERLAPLIFFHPPPHRIFGNLGQPNLFAHYLAWSVIGAAWLVHTQRRFRFRVALGAALATFLFLNMSFSGSRSVFLYLLTWLALSLYALGSRRFSRESIELARLIAVFAIIGTAVHLFGAPLHTAIASVFETVQPVVAAINEIDRGDFGARRLVEWQKAWAMFTAAPVVGIGWGNYAAASFNLQVDRPDLAVESVLFTHTHNLFAQVAAEQGMVGVGVAIFLVVYAVRKIRAADSAIHLALACLLSVTFIHSLLEYPLWDFHFLLVAGLLLAAAEIRSGPPIRVLPRSLHALLGISALILLFSYWQNFNFINANQMPAANLQLRKFQKESLTGTSRVPAIEYVSQLALLNHMPLGDGDALRLAEKLVHFRPLPQVQLRLACEYGRAGQTAARERALLHLRLAYPDRADGTETFLRRLNC